MMSMRAYKVLAATAALTIWAAAPGYALTMQECSVKYKAAQSAGTLKGVKWNEFRKAECGHDAAAVAPAPVAAPKAAKSATTGLGSIFGRAGDATFPTAVSPKYANESAGKARMHTCLDQYKANKAGSGNGSLKWIQKGGGYYSECNKRLSSSQ
jgi:hypothetical protein